MKSNQKNTISTLTLCVSSTLFIAACGATAPESLEADPIDEEDKQENPNHSNLDPGTTEWSAPTGPVGSFATDDVYTVVNNAQSPRGYTLINLPKDLSQHCLVDPRIAASPVLETLSGGIFQAHRKATCVVPLLSFEQVSEASPAIIQMFQTSDGFDAHPYYELPATVVLPHPDFQSRRWYHLDCPTGTQCAEAITLGRSYSYGWAKQYPITGQYSRENSPFSGEGQNGLMLSTQHYCYTGRYTTAKDAEAALETFCPLDKFLKDISQHSAGNGQAVLAATYSQYYTDATPFLNWYNENM